MNETELSELVKEYASLKERKTVFEMEFKLLRDQIVSYLVASGDAAKVSSMIKLNVLIK